jgi:hypothetical protein
MLTRSAIRRLFATLPASVTDRKQLTHVVILISERLRAPLIECDEDDALATSLGTNDTTSCARKDSRLGALDGRVLDREAR